MWSGYGGYLNAILNTLNDIRNTFGYNMEGLQYMAQAMQGGDVSDFK